MLQRLATSCQRHGLYPLEVERERGRIAPVYGPYFDRVAARATGDTQLVEVRRARREFQELTGKFEEDEPWFEQRMTLFLEWFVLDRPTSDGLTPVERFLLDEAPSLEDEELEIFEGLAATHRSLMRLERWQNGRIDLTDMIGGGSWSVLQEDSMIGLQRGDFLDLRIVPFRGEQYLGRGMLFHPRIASEHIQKVLEVAHASGHLTFDLVNMLASQRIRFDRYRNMKVQHIYRPSPEWSSE